MKRAIAFLILSLLAASSWAQTPNNAPTASDTAAQEALKLVQAGDINGALQKLEPLRQDQSANPRVLSLLGALYLQAGKPQEALAVLKPLADAEDADPAVLYNAGRAALALGQAEAGQRYLERSV
ncbi:MAG: tetratricopeptide repeat protein, partial [Thermoanaerobaculia bacterium]